MYYPGENQYYWLASPSAYGTEHVRYVTYSSGGNVNTKEYSGHYYAFCPLVSLESSTKIELVK